MFKIPLLLIPPPTAGPMLLVLKLPTTTTEPSVSVPRLEMPSALEAIADRVHADT